MAACLCTTQEYIHLRISVYHEKIFEPLILNSFTFLHKLLLPSGIKYVRKACISERQTLSLSEISQPVELSNLSMGRGITRLLKKQQV